MRGEFYLVFFRQGGGFRLWKASDGFSSLLAFATVSTDRDAQLREIARRCSRGGDLLGALGLALDWEAMGAEAPEPGRADDEWALVFLDRSTETPAGAAALPAEIVMRYPGRRGGRTVVQAIVGIDPAHLPAAGGEARRFVLDGEVLRRGELFENFRYRFDRPVTVAGDGVSRGRVGGASASGERASIPLVVQRYLRPGPYRLVVKVREVEADRFFGGSAEIEVPLVERRGGEGSPPLVERRRSEGSPLRGIALDAGQKTRAPSRPETAIPDWLAEANAAGPLLGDAPGGHGVRIHALPERLITGRVRVGADAHGPGIHRLAFSLDGRERISKRRPPYQVEIDVGAAPRAHSLRVDAYDGEGSVLATDEVAINSGPHRFAVRLTSPRRGAAHTRSVRAAAEVEAPPPRAARPGRVLPERHPHRHALPAAVRAADPHRPGRGPSPTSAPSPTSRPAPGPRTSSSSTRATWSRRSRSPWSSSTPPSPTARARPSSAWPSPTSRSSSTANGSSCSGSTTPSTSRSTPASCSTRRCR